MDNFLIISSPCKVQCLLGPESLDLVNDIGCWLKSHQRWDRVLSDLLLMALGRGARNSSYGYARKLLQGKLRPSSVQCMLAEESRCFAPGHNWDVAGLQGVDHIALYQQLPEAVTHNSPSEWQLY